MRLESGFPEDLSVIGFDNIEFAKASNPKLSIVTQPTKEIGRNVAELILDRLDNPTREMPPKEMKLKTSFVEGKSVHMVVCMTRCTISLSRKPKRFGMFWRRT